ncbi:MAG: hypothetical protein RL757_877 [Bacteroidota bacterium]|jgi:hypothetical protein
MFGRFSEYIYICDIIYISLLYRIGMTYHYYT